MSFSRLKSLFRLQNPGPTMWLMVGHGATHWVMITFYLLLPVLTETYELSYTQAGLLVSAFQLGSFCLSLVSGPAVDLTGRRVIFQVVALVVLGIGTAGFGLVDNFTALVAIAWLIGGATNFWHAPATAFLSSYYPSNRGYVIGIHGVGSNMGEAYGSIVAGAMIATVGWQTTSMAIGAPTILCAIAIAVFLLPKDRVHRAETGKPGMTLKDYLSGLYSVLRNPEVMMLFLMVGVRAAAQNLIKTFLPLYMGHVLAMNALWQGIGISAMHHGGMVANPIMGLASDKVGRRPILVITLFATAAIMLGLTLTGNAVVFITGVAIMGFSHYALRPVVQSWILDVVPEDLHGSSVSLRSAMQGLFSVAIPPVGGWVGDTYGLEAVFYLVAALLLIANAMVWFLPDPRTREARQAADAAE